MHDNYILNNCKYIINLYDYTCIKYTCFTHNLKTSHMCYTKADVEILKKSNIANACNHYDCNKQSLYKSIDL